MEGCHGFGGDTLAKLMIGGLSWFGSCDGF